MLMLISCTSNDYPIETSKDTSHSSHPLVYTMEEVRELAMRGAMAVRGKSSRSPLVVSQIHAICTPASRSYISDTLIYAIDFEDEQGFAMISKRRIDNPLLAVIDNGHFNPDDLNKDNPFGAYVLSMMATQASTPTFPTPNPGYDELFIDYQETEVNNAPKMPQFWGQAYPFGSLCPNKLCGCVALSTIMAMAYWEHPSNITLTYNGHTTNTLSIDWE